VRSPQRPDDRAMILSVQPKDTCEDELAPCLLSRIYIII
jgi:hypothetical protein